jgi:hypothetical protein
MGYFWIAPEITLYSFLAYLSIQNNCYALWALGCFPLWAIVSHYSKNLFFDGLLYDSIMILSYAISILYFQNTLKSIGINQVIGVMMILGGLFLLRSL